jgi:heat shock protein HslJ
MALIFVVLHVSWLSLASIVQTPAQPPANAGLEGRWRAVELVGTPVGSQKFQEDREPHLVFGADGRVSGADGCNVLTGPYTVKGEAITFGLMAGTQMACINTEDIERKFRGTLTGTSHWRIVNDRLEFYGATGKPLAVFEREPATSSSPEGPAALEGTRWQLVKFVGGDDRTLTPDDPTKYTIEFAADGSVVAQIDCNRGRGTWKATPYNQLELGPLALTRAQCPEGSLHDQIVKQWPNVRSFLIRDGHLFLALKIDSGIYEFAPITSPR